MKRGSLYISLLSIVLGLSIGYNVIQDKSYKELQSSSDALKMSLNEVSVERDSAVQSNLALNLELDQYKYRMDSVNALVKENRKELYRLSVELDMKIKEAQDLTTDEKYEVIKEGYGSVWDMPVSGTYTFTELEVDSIFDDAIRVKYLDSIRYEQNIMINNMRYQLKLAVGTLDNLEEDNLEKQKLIEELYRRLDRYEADNRHLREQVGIWKKRAITGGAIGVGALALLIGLL